MAWNEFYMQTTGSNLNAGSTNTDAATATSTNGGWSTTTNVFTASSGTPFASVTVGQWASIYVDAATSTTFVGQITARTNTTVTISTTIRIGSVPTTAASGISCKVGGAWANLAVVTSLGSLTLPMPFRVNVKAGTYANTTTSRNFAWTGSNSNPVWVRGYSSTPGDLDNDTTTTKPLFSFTTGSITFGGSYNLYSDLQISSTRTAGGAVIINLNAHLDRCIIENTGAATTAYAIQTTGNGSILSRSWIRASTSANYTIFVNGHALSLLGNWIEGRSVLSQIEYAGGTAVVIGNVIVHDSASSNSAGIRISSAVNHQVILDNTIHMVTSGTANKTGILITAEPASTQARFWANNIITGTDSTRHTAMNIGSPLTSPLDHLTIMNNYYQGVVETSGIRDFVSGDRSLQVEYTDTSSPYTNAGAKDFSLTASNNALYNGFPKSFQFDAIVNHKDIGAVQSQSTDSLANKLLRLGVKGGMF